MILECDELWSFVGKRQQHRRERITDQLMCAVDQAVERLGGLRAVAGGPQQVYEHRAWEAVAGLKPEAAQQGFGFAATVEPDRLSLKTAGTT